MSTTPNETPQRATAAQMATRKIKELNRRRVKPTTSSGLQPSFSFGDAASSNAGASNGFSLGQSQSFPAPSASSTSQNGTQPISFGGGGSSPFNFSGFNSTSMSNPFANLNGGNTQTQGQAQSPALFGTQSTAQPAQSSGMSLFSQSTNTGFQAPSANKASGLFGQSTATAPPSSSFQQSQTGSTGSSLFGQTKPASTGLSFFGQGSSAPTSSATPAASVAPGPLFSQQTASTTSAPIFQSKPPTSGTSSLFGQNSLASAAPTTNVFGQSSENSAAAGTTTASASNGASIFQSKPTSTGSPFSFAKTTTASTSAPSLFGQSTAAKDEKSPTFTPSTPNKTSGSLFANTSSSNIFNFGSTTSATTKPLFNAGSDTDEMSTSPDAKSKTSVQSSTVSNIFGQNKPQISASAPEVGRQGSSLFGTTIQSGAANPPSPSSSASSIFGQQQSRSVSPGQNNITGTASSLFAPPTRSNPFSSLFTASTSKQATPAPATSATTAPSLFSGTSTTAPSSTPFKFGVATTTTPSQSQPAAVSQPAQPLISSTFQKDSDERLGGQIMDNGLSKSAGDAQVSSAELSEQNKLRQVRDLNRGFQRLIAKYDPETQGLDSVILHYIRMRKAIDMPIGSAVNKPGKRKLDDTHGIESPAQRSTTKRSRADAAESESDVPSLIPQPSSALKRKSVEDLDNSHEVKRQAQASARPATSLAGSDGKSATASIFASSFSAPKAAAPSGNVSIGSNSGSLGSTALSAKKGFEPPTQQNSIAADKPTFEVPKFGNAGQNFAGQFGKGSFKPTSGESSKIQLEVPKFSTSGQSFMSQFAQKAKGGDDTDEDSSDSDAEPAAEKTVQESKAAQAPTSTVSGSIFDRKPGTPFMGTTNKNIFGHLNTSTVTSDAAESSDDEGTSEALKQVKKNKLETGGESKTTSSLFDRIRRPDGTPVNLSSDDEQAEAPKQKSLFGQTTSNVFTTSNTNTSSLFSSTPNSRLSSNMFGGPSTTPSSNPFVSSLNPAAHILATEGTTTASVTSDSNAEDTDTETLKDTQLNLLTNAGEEGEDCILEVRSRGMKHVEKTENGKMEKAWETQGVGPLRILVNKETKRARFLLRADPSGKAVLNTAISRSIDYKFQPGGCTFLVPRAEGGMDFWALRFKKETTSEVEKALKTAKEGLLS